MNINYIHTFLSTQNPHPHFKVINILLKSGKVNKVLYLSYIFNFILWKIALIILSFVNNPQMLNMWKTFPLFINIYNLWKTVENSFRSHGYRVVDKFKLWNVENSHFFLIELWKTLKYNYSCLRFIL